MLTYYLILFPQEVEFNSPPECGLDRVTDLLLRNRNPIANTHLVSVWGPGKRVPETLGISWAIRTVGVSFVLKMGLLVGSYIASEMGPGGKKTKPWSETFNVQFHSPSLWGGKAFGDWVNHWWPRIYSIVLVLWNTHKTLNWGLCRSSRLLNMCKCWEVVHRELGSPNWTAGHPFGVRELENWCGKTSHIWLVCEKTFQE